MFRFFMDTLQSVWEMVTKIFCSFFWGGGEDGGGGNENFTALHTQKQTAIKIRLIKTAIAK